MRYNPPPNWPPAPAGWQPPAGWEPDPSWGPAPHGWPLWINDDGSSTGPAYGSSASRSVPPQKKKGHKVRNVVLAVLVLIVGGSIIGSLAGGSTPSSPSTPTVGNPSAGTTTAPKVQSNNDKAVNDIAITSCATDDAGFMEAKVTITNHSSKPSNYLVTIAFETKDGGTQLGTGTAIVNGLQPGQKSPQDANSLTEAKGAAFTCRVSDVTRYAS